MSYSDEFGPISAFFLAVLLRFTFRGASCQLVVSPAGPTLQTALVGHNVTLAVSFAGAPDPVVIWSMADVPVVTWVINSADPPVIAEASRNVLRIDANGSLSFINVPLGYTSNYTIEMTKSGLGKSSITFTLKVFARPAGDSTCSLQSVNSVDLQYYCQWPGGTPPARLSFPALNSSRSGEGNLSLIFPASPDLDGKMVTCLADHPVELSNCSITAGGPSMFLPAVRTTVDPDGKILVTIDCVSEASPPALVSWSKGSDSIVGTATHQISRDTTELQIHDYDVSIFLLQNYACTCRNPLGSQRREIQLRGPLISDSRLFTNHNGTIVTLTWEVPPTSIVTGFDVQMKGPNSLSRNRSGNQTRGSSDWFHTIQQKPGHARSADIFFLDPKLTYGFRIIPKARGTAGPPSEAQTAGPGEGLSGSAIAGLAAGIPCGLLLLVLLGGFIYLCVYLHKKKSRQTRYPKPRAVEKAVTAPAELTPHNLLTGGLRSPPDYNRLQQTPSERSAALPAFVPAPPVRTATIV